MADELNIPTQETAESGERGEQDASRRLDDATFEPQALIEQSGDFRQAEVIQDAFVAVMDGAAANKDAESEKAPAEDAQPPAMIDAGEDTVAGREPKIVDGVFEKLPEDGPDKASITPINLPDYQDANGSNSAAVDAGEDTVAGREPKIVGGVFEKLPEDGPDKASITPINLPDYQDANGPKSAAVDSGEDTVAGREPKIVDAILTKKSGGEGGDKENITPINLPNIKDALGNAGSAETAVRQSTDAPAIKFWDGAGTPEALRQSAGEIGFPKQVAGEAPAELNRSTDAPGIKFWDGAGTPEALRQSAGEIGFPKQVAGEAPAELNRSADAPGIKFWDGAVTLAEGAGKNPFVQAAAAGRLGGSRAAGLANSSSASPDQSSTSAAESGGPNDTAAVQDKAAPEGESEKSSKAEETEGTGEKWSPPEVYVHKNQDGSVTVVDANGNPVPNPPLIGTHDGQNYYAYYPGYESEAFDCPDYTTQLQSNWSVYKAQDGTLTILDSNGKLVPGQPLIGTHDGQNYYAYYPDDPSKTVSLANYSQDLSTASADWYVYKSPDGKLSVVDSEGNAVPWAPILATHDGKNYYAYYPGDPAKQASLSDYMPSYLQGLGGANSVVKGSETAETSKWSIYIGQDGKATVVDENGNPIAAPPIVSTHDGQNYYAYYPNGDKGNLTLELPMWKTAIQSNWYVLVGQDGTPSVVDASGNPVSGAPVLTTHDGTNYTAAYPGDASNPVSLANYSQSLTGLYACVDQDGKVKVVDADGNAIAGQPLIGTHDGVNYYAYYPGDSTVTPLDYYRPTSSP
jgi:hypothetical protein